MNRHILAIIIGWLAGVLCFVGCADTSHDYRLTNIHTGEEIILGGEPYGHGWNHGLPGQSGDYYWWQVASPGGRWGGSVDRCDIRKVPKSEWRCERIEE
jgi:hypothetical protein